MIQRLITLVSKADKLLKNGLLTINVKIVNQFQPRYFKFRKFIHRSKYDVSQEQWKAFDTPLCPNTDNNGGTAKTDGKETKEKQNTDKRTHSASSTSPPRFTSKAPNQGSKFGGKDLGGCSRKYGNRARFFPKGFGRAAIDVGLIYAVLITTVSLYLHFHNREKSYEDITWEDFVNNYFAQSRVLERKPVNTEWLRAHAHTAPGTSADEARTVLVKIEGLDAFEIAYLLARTLGNAGKGKPAEIENDPPVVEKKLHYRLRTPLFCYESYWP